MSTAATQARTPSHHEKDQFNAGFEAWKAGVDKADAKWDAHDKLIQEAVVEYNRHLSTTPYFFPLDWKIVKAMLWVESGPHRAAWNTRPMQIGVPDDPGLSALLGGHEGGELVVPPSFALSASSARTNARENIRAGVGYLLMRMAEFKFKSVMEPSAITFPVTVARGDSLESLAKTHATTVEVLKQLNPGISILRPGQVLKCQKASKNKVIVGWRSIDASSIAARYNGGGDPQYARKLAYALAAVRR